MVFDTDFHAIDPEVRRTDPFNLAIAPVEIESDVWLGARSIVLKGVRVGAGSVVAAGAVVTKDVPPGTLVAGVPAKVVGKTTETPSG
jgi:acetyltransferase-like isoleucine patch superfamily enzyme